jgi:hypothetical protein
MVAFPDMRMVMGTRWLCKDDFELRQIEDGLASS